MRVYRTSRGLSYLGNMAHVDRKYREMATKEPRHKTMASYCSGQKCGWKVGNIILGRRMWRAGKVSYTTLSHGKSWVIKPYPI